jgi:predicted nucleic acid-binding protein
MLIHLDTSVMVDAFTGPRRSLRHVEAATLAGHVLAYCALVEYEWRRGPRTNEEEKSVQQFFGDDVVVPFGEREAATAASLYRGVKRARQRQADLAVAACAIEQGARLWTLNGGDFDDVPGLSLYRPPG